MSLRGNYHATHDPKVKRHIESLSKRLATTPQTSQTYEMMKPKVRFRVYWLEATLLLLSFATPIIAWLIWHDAVMLARSGSIMVFFAAVAEFRTISWMNKKHLLNACRVRVNETPWDFSLPAKIVGYVSVSAALLGTILWGYGDLLVRNITCLYWSTCLGA